MKKLFLILAIVLLASLGAKAQSSDGYWISSTNNSYTEEYYDWSEFTKLLEMFVAVDGIDWRNGRDAIDDIHFPGGHGWTDHTTGGDPAPIGSGVLLLISFGGAYAVAKKHRKE